MEIPIDDARRRSFDRVAKKYHATRPHYPEALIESVVRYGGLTGSSAALEIGSGTGIATQPFAKRLGAITGLEPGENLCALCRDNLKSFPRVRIDRVRFEDFEGKQGVYDLVFSAQAFHWIPTELGYKKSHYLLKRGGTLALFWNMSDRDTWDEPLRQGLDAVYAQYFPKDLSSFGRLPKSAQFEEIVRDREVQIEQSHLFRSVQVERFPWERIFASDEYLELLDTYSENLALETTTREKFYAEIRTTLDAFGGKIRIPYQAVLYLAKAI